MAENNVALRKRQQIENAGKTMFLWVAVASAVVSMAAVVSYSMFERISFNNEIIGAMNETADTLKKNNETVDGLKENVRVMNTNEALTTTPRLEGSEPISVILDALPSSPNSSALGASLQQKLLNIDGVSIESLTVQPISGVEDDGTGSEDSDEENQISFTFSVSTSAEGGADRLKRTLQNLEKSVRVIDLTNVDLEQRSNKLTLSVDGLAFYQPETKVELKEKSCKPGKEC